MTFSPTDETAARATDRLTDTEAFKALVLERLDPEEFLESFGVEIAKRSRDELRCACPIHHGDNESAFQVATERGGTPAFRWRCHTQCEIDHGDVIDFVMLMLNLSFKEAVSWLAARVGLSDDFEIDESEWRDRREVAKFNSASRAFEKERVEFDFINEDFVRKCVARRNTYFAKRGFPDEILDLFEVGYCPEHDSPWNLQKTLVKARATIPLRDEEGRLVGMSGRALVEAPDKYNILAGSAKRSILYGLHLAKPYVAERNSIVVVEGFADVWRAWQHGKRNVVAICGKDATDEQVRLILSHARTVAIALDGDKAGRLGADKLQNALVDYVDVYRVPLPVERDFGDMSFDEFYFYLKNSVKRLDKVPIRD